MRCRSNPEVSGQSQVSEQIFVEAKIQIRGSTNSYVTVGT